MTGRMPHENGITINMEPPERPFPFPMLGRVMTEAGYDCGYVGKWHLPVKPSQVDVHGFTTLQHARANRLDQDVPDASIEFLSRRRDRPFLLVSSFVNPHDICEWARADELKNGALPSPPAPASCPDLPHNFEIPADEPEVLREIQKRDAGAYPTVGWSADRWRQYRWAYYRLIEMVDGHIANILDALRRTGQEERTVIIFSSDHGDGTGAHRWNQKQILYEEVVRVPFIVSWEGVTEAARVDRKTLVSAGLDLMPTICDYGGVTPPAKLSGRSLRPCADGRALNPSRELVVVETEFCGFGKSHGLEGRMLRTDRYKYIVYSKGQIREQFFDLQADPGETRSLVASRAHTQELERHRRLLKGWCQETGDGFGAS